MQFETGYHQLPPGKIANSVAWMELTDLSREASTAPPDLSLRRLGSADTALHRRVYRMVGEPWLWSGHIDKTEAALSAYLGHPDVMSFALMEQDRPIGLLELAFGPPEGAEIVQFGLAPAEGGKGAGGWMMDQAIRIAREAGIRRLWLHTCNFDHPKAIAFYRRQGFRVYAQGFEIMDDPRASGLLPPTAAPHVPMIEG